MVRRVYMPIFGSGLGHANRMMLIAKSLQKDGAEVRFSSSFEVANYLTDKGFNCNIVPLVDVKWNEKGELSVSTVSREALPAFKNFVHQLMLEIAEMRSLAPNLVLSDSRLSGVLAAKLLGLPSFVILNQVRILFSTRKRRILPVLEDIDAEILGKLWSFCKGIILPDLPPPYTISERNLWGVGSIKGKFRYVGFMVQKPVIDERDLERISKELNIKKERPTVFAQISGPSPTKKKIVKTVLKTAKIYGGKYNFVISEGVLGGKSEAIKFDGGVYYEWCPIKDELFALADLVIIRAGHSTIAQSILFGKPMVTIPISTHSEQISNAKKVLKLGIGTSMDQRYLSPEKIEEAISSIIEDGCVRNVEKLKSIANKFDGVKNTVNMIKDYIRST
ncbi:MAG: hypothetical protein L6N94_05305 [Candidatus Methylarchaceae archaeon HK01M]|nr:hypothetical protein [Candidatus Methylarchaceae archaeon HK01M]